eukprot:12446826-Prorocentrum_lima.AAC.1
MLLCAAGRYRMGMQAAVTEHACCATVSAHVPGWHCLRHASEHHRLTPDALQSGGDHTEQTRRSGAD